MKVRSDEGRINSIKLKYKGFEVKLLHVPGDTNKRIALENPKLEEKTLEIELEDLVETEALISIFEKFAEKAKDHMGAWYVKN